MRKGERRKQDFMAAAQTLFAQKGYQSTSIQDMLDELGVSKGSFYHHFETKFDVLAELARAQAADALNDYLENSPPDALDALNDLLFRASFLSPKSLPLVMNLPALSRAYEAQALLSTIREAVFTAFYTPFERLMKRLRLEERAMYSDAYTLAASLHAFLAACANLMLTREAETRNGLLRAQRRMMEAGLGLPAFSLTVFEDEGMRNALERLHA